MENVVSLESHRAARGLHQNRLALARKLGCYPLFTPPAPDHYLGLYLWDEGFHAITDARHGSRASLYAAKSGVKTMLRGQHESGFIPNFQEFGPRRKIEPERWFGYEEDSHSNYIQPPVIGVTIVEVDQALRSQKVVDPQEAEAEANRFLAEVYEPAAHFYKYIDKTYRLGDDDRRIFITHPHATGRDSDPTYDILKPYRLQRDGVYTPWYVDKANIVLDYFQIIHFGHKLRRAGGDIEKVRELFGVTDLMMNCILVDNLHEMAGLAEKVGNRDDAQYFSQYATDVEQTILERMWFPGERAGEGAFYSTDKNGQPIKEITINNLFPLLLPNISADQLHSLLNMVDEHFKTPYPLPSVGINSRNFDPHNREWDRLWRGGVWMNTNWLLVERGLNKQAWRGDMPVELRKRSYELAEWIKVRSETLLAMNGAREFYNPLTGAGQRRRVKNFGWSYLAWVLRVAKPNDLEEELAEAA